MANLLNLTEDSFQKLVSASPVPVLVDFWAPWCGPCRAIAPVLEAVAQELDGKVTVAKVNVDDAQGLAQRYGIQFIPTLLLFKSGAENPVQIPAQPNKAALSRAILAHAG